MSECRKNGLVFEVHIPLQIVIDFQYRTLAEWGLTTLFLFTFVLYQVISRHSDLARYFVVYFTPLVASKIQNCSKYSVKHTVSVSTLFLSRRK